MQREFFDPVDRGLRFIEEARIESARGVLTFENHAERAARAAVDPDVIPSADARPGGELKEDERIAHAIVGKVQRELVHFVSAEDRALLGGLGLEQRRVGAHGDQVGGRAYLQDDIDARGLSYLDRDPGLDELPEGRVLHRQAVGSGGNRGDCVVAGFSADRAQLLIGRQVGGNDRHAGHDATPLIGDGAGNGSAVALC